MTKLINLTPHAIVVKNGNQEKTYPASGTVARVNTTSLEIGVVDGFLIMEQSITGHNVPAPQKGVMYIVSAMVLAQLPGRSDLVAPDTNNAERNDKGHIVSVPAFTRGMR